MTTKLPQNSGVEKMAIECCHAKERSGTNVDEKGGGREGKSRRNPSQEKVHESDPPAQRVSIRCKSEGGNVGKKK